MPEAPPNVLPRLSLGEALWLCGEKNASNLELGGVLSEKSLKGNNPCAPIAGPVRDPSCANNSPIKAAWRETNIQNTTPAPQTASITAQGHAGVHPRGFRARRDVGQARDRLHSVLCGRSPVLLPATMPRPAADDKNAQSKLSHLTPRTAGFLIRLPNAGSTFCRRLFFLTANTCARRSVRPPASLSQPAGVRTPLQAVSCSFPQDGHGHLPARHAFSAPSLTFTSDPLLRGRQNPSPRPPRSLPGPTYKKRFVLSAEDADDTVTCAGLYFNKAYLDRWVADPTVVPGTAGPVGMTKAEKLKYKAKEAAANTDNMARTHPSPTRHLRAHAAHSSSLLKLSRMFNKSRTQGLEGPAGNFWWWDPLTPRLMLTLTPFSLARSCLAIPFLLSAGADPDHRCNRPFHLCAFFHPHFPLSCCPR